MGLAGAKKQDWVRPVGAGVPSNSARAGYLPLSLDRVPLAAMKNIDIFVRAAAESGQESFALFRASAIDFTDLHRQRLVQAGVKFIYIPVAQQSAFRRQREASLLDLASDATMAGSVRAEIVYETSVELVNELLSEPDLASQSPRLRQVSRAITMLVLNDPGSFSHLFAASHHDFYTATHMVNVGTWMVPLAYAMGYRDMEELSHICQAGMLHDIGKMSIPAEILNKEGKLSTAEWDLVRRHPQLGYEHLCKCEDVDPLVRTVALEHHERMDGRGYPRKLRGEQIHPVSRICAVVDSFDAMTALRPFRQHSVTIDDAMKRIIEETPLKYDMKAMTAWADLLHAADKLAGPSPLSGAVAAAHHGRLQQRFRINCPARVHILQEGADGLHELAGLQAVVHNISRSGLGILSQTRVEPGERTRVFLLGE